MFGANPREQPVALKKGESYSRLVESTAVKRPPVVDWFGD